LAVRLDIKADIVVAVPGGVIEIVGSSSLAEDVMLVLIIKDKFKDSERKPINLSYNIKIKEIINKYSSDGFVSGI